MLVGETNPNPKEDYAGIVASFVPSTAAHPLFPSIENGFKNHQTCFHTLKLTEIIGRSLSSRPREKGDWTAVISR